MSGIAAFFARESVPDFESIIEPMINAYLDFSINQHIDAVVVDRSDRKQGELPIVHDFDGTYKEIEEDDAKFNSLKTFYKDYMKIGNLMFFSVGHSCVRWDKDKRLVLANNSSNKRTFYKRLDTSEYLSKLYIDNQRDMKRTLEDCDQCDINLLACDIQKENLMSANDGHAGIQMCHAYIKGIGFMLHQNMVCLRNIIHHFTDCSQDAVNLWETWYGHPLEGEVIRETDLESGSMRKIKFNPKFSY